LSYQHGDFTPNWIWTNTAKNPASPPHFEARWQIDIVLWLLYSARLIRTGRWIARRLPGRETAGCVSVALTGWIAVLVIPGFSVSPSFYAVSLTNDLILFAGALWMRGRFQPTAAH